MSYSHTRVRQLLSRRNQRGAVMVMTVPVVLLSFVAAALSVDIGRQVLEKRADQSVADLAALDAARAVGGFPPATPAAALAGAAQTAAVASAGRNGFGSDPTHAVTALLGSVDPATNTFVPTGTSAVQVTIASAIDYVFSPGTKSVSARAVALVGSPEAAFSVGSTLSSLDTKKSGLDPILSTWLGSGSLALVSYDGLAGANLKLSSLQGELLRMGLDVGTTQKLLDADLTLAQLLTATAQALGQDGEPTARTEVEDLINASITTSTTLKLGRFIKIQQPTSDAALEAAVNVFQLVTSSAQVASSSSFVDVPLTGITVPGVTGVTLKVKVIEPAQIGIGPVGTTADTSQVALRLTADVPLGALQPTAAVTLDYTSANALATLTELRCGVATPGISLAAATSAVNVSGTGTVPTGTMAIWSTIGSSSAATYVFDHPTKFSPYSEHIGATTLGVATSVNVTGTGATVPLAPLLQSELPPTLTTINTALSPVIQPLLAALGLNIAAADLTALSIVPDPATCGGTPRLAQ